LIATIDRAVFAGYCTTWQNFVTAYTELQKTGLLIRSPQNYPLQNPYLSIVNQALKQIRLYAGEFGLSPGSRARVSAAEIEREDEFEEFLSRGRLNRARD
jgi:P27 family predicted phage terminase small subunit